MNKLEIYNATGEMVCDYKADAMEVIEIETSGFPEGVYFYKVINEYTGQMVEGKMIVEAQENPFKETSKVTTKNILSPFLHRQIAKGILNLFL